MSTTTRSHWFSSRLNQPIADDSSSALPTTRIGAISSSAATRFSRITGLSSTMNALSCVMDDRSSTVPDADCGAARGTREEAASGRQETGTLCEGGATGRVSGIGSKVGQERSAISLVGIVLQALFIAALIARRRRRRGPRPTSRQLVVGSKRFTESYVLGEIVTQTLVASGRPAVHRQGLGNTGILEQALASGAVDLYPEYTGTIVRELLKREGNPSLEELNRWLAAARPGGGGAVRLQQHLCAGDERSAGEEPRHLAHLRPRVGAGTRASSSACRTSSCSAPTAGRRCARPMR